MGRLLTDQRTFRLLAIGRAVAFPVTKRLLADALACRSRVRALSVACRLFANGVTFRAGTLFTMLDRAAHLTLWLVTLDLTLRASKLLAASGAARLLTNWFAYLVADGRGAFPLASVMIFWGKSC